MQNGIFFRWLFGILKIPDKQNLQGKFLLAAYYVRKGEVIFLDEDEVIYPVFKKLKNMEDKDKVQELEILLAVFNGLIENEVPYLQKIEEEITELEDILIVQLFRDFPSILMRFRKAMMHLHGFYVQFLDVIEEIQGNLGKHLSEEDEIRWKMLASRVSAFMVIQRTFGKIFCSFMNYIRHRLIFLKMKL